MYPPFTAHGSHRQPHSQNKYHSNQPNFTPPSSSFHFPSPPTSCPSLLKQQIMVGSVNYHRRPLVLPPLLVWSLLLLLMLTCLVGHCHGSSSSSSSSSRRSTGNDDGKNVFRVVHDRPNKHHRIGPFFGYLPRGMPIPASGPSRRHNDIGIQSSTSSP